MSTVKIGVSTVAVYLAETNMTGNCDNVYAQRYFLYIVFVHFYTVGTVHSEGWLLAVNTYKVFLATRIKRKDTRGAEKRRQRKIYKAFLAILQEKAFLATLHEKAFLPRLCNSTTEDLGFVGQLCNCTQTTTLDILVAGCRGKHILGNILIQSIILSL